MRREDTWWGLLNQCKAVTKRGTRCQRDVRHPFERQPGDMRIAHAPD